MGGDLLRRKNLKFMRNTARKRRFIKRQIIFLVFCISVFTANADNERPLRSAAPQSRSGASDYSPNVNRGAFNFDGYALLTKSSLENPLTMHYITYYSSPVGIAYLNTVLERGNIYMSFIREEIERRNLPFELLYLPVIESGFQITAKSKSGAAGLWQFMMNSISPFGIKVNDYIDERQDFIKSTRGALQKLEDNYKALGSWELAIAAYNCGLGQITRTVQRTKIYDFWELTQKKEIRQETEHYVPKLIAITYIFSQPRRFGINIWHKPFEWVAIPLQRQISLDVLAEEAGIERDLLRRLNAELLHGITMQDNSRNLIVPAVHYENVSRVLEREDLKLLRFNYHIVSKGDTLWGMSRLYGTSLDLIEQHNPGISDRYLRIGETVVIPALN
jgi:membrane-bound lytic murein transglycosylase D